jgi:transposase InsO family protein
VFSVVKMCKVLEVSKSGFYKWLTAEISLQAQKKAKVMEQIAYEYEASDQIYGSPKITEELHAKGFFTAQRTVSVYMREMGLRACVSHKFKVMTTDSDHDLPIAPNLLNQQFKVLEPCKVWTADITYIPCREGQMYLASILDLCTREIVGWRLGDRMTTDLVLGALEMAYAAKKPEKGLIHHSDRGTQYAAKDYREKLEAYGMVASMSRKGNCYDNAPIESFHSILKKELVYRTRFRTKQEAQDKMFKYIEFFYNRKRIHSALGYVSPARFAKQLATRIV